LNANAFTLTGSAVYIYGIDQANFMAGMVFTLGSDTATHYYPNTEPIIFRSLFFSASGLPSQSHTVTWKLVANPTLTGGNVDPQEVVFDYAVVTSEEVVDVPSSGPGKPVVVGNTSGKSKSSSQTRPATTTTTMSSPTSHTLS
jgi:hypothetical protein